MHWAAVFLDSAKLAELHDKQAEVVKVSGQHAAASMEVLHTAKVLL